MSVRSGMIGRGYAVALAAACLAAPAMAQNLTAPEGCTMTLTVQSRGCVVDNFWTCEADAPGDQWRAEYGIDGPRQISRTDAETQWVDSIELPSMQRWLLESPAPDPASFSELLETGVDTYDFTVAGDPGRIRLVGFDRIVEAGVAIDGEPLQRTDYSIRATDGTGGLIYEKAGSEYISVRHGRFFSGYGSDTAAPGESWDNSPMQFIYPGDPGFAATVPLYDCAALNARFVPNRKDLKP
jgi:hypothetical protein